MFGMCLQLRLITEIICAPRISAEQITYLKVIIDDYLELRSHLFSDILKLKYPSLIIQFGPLIRLGTLRFESKHSYFQKCL